MVCSMSSVKSDVIVWECRNCWHIVVGTHAPEACSSIHELF